MLTRIFTELKNYEQVKELTAKYFESATFIKAEGIWQGESELSLIIEIDSLRSLAYIQELCQDIKELNLQNAVLVQRIETQSEIY